MYVTTAWSKVFALDAATGKQLWAFDPAGARERGRQGVLRCGQSRRGRLERQDLRRHDRRPSHRARCRYGQAGVDRSTVESDDIRSPTPSPARRAS